MNLIAVYILVLIFSSAVSVTAAILIIRKVVLWRTTKSEARLHDFFTERFSYVLAFYGKDTVSSVKTSFLAMLKRSNRVGKFSRRKKREVARRVMMKMTEDIVGENRDFLSHLYDEFGFADDAISELHDHRWWKRADAVRELRLMHVTRAVEGISKLLSDPSGEVRLLAFETVIEMDGINSLPVLAGMLRKMTPWSAINISGIILEYKNEAAPHVLPLVRHTDISVRSFAIRMLGVLRSVEAVPVLVKLAGSAKPAEVREAISALGFIGDERAVQICVSALAANDASVRIAAANALGLFGDSGLVPRLLPLLEDDVNNVRLAAGQALSRCGKDGAAALEAAFITGSERASRAARHVLDDIELSTMTPIIAGEY